MTEQKIHSNERLERNQKPASTSNFLRDTKRILKINALI